MVLGMANIIIQYRYITEYNQRVEYQNNINYDYNLSQEEIQSLHNDRDMDILERGENHFVYDLNGKTVKLKNADLWHNNGKYVNPKTSRIDSCVIS